MYFIFNLYKDNIYYLFEIIMKMKLVHLSMHKEKKLLVVVRDTKSIIFPIELLE